jgi:hypothetical protein
VLVAVAVAVAGGVVFGGVELSFFCANLSKGVTGGWPTLMIAATVLTAMLTWRRGREPLLARRVEMEGPLPDFIAGVRAASIPRVPGTAVYPHPTKQTTPLALRATVERMHVLHERVVIRTGITDDVPHIPWPQRLRVDHLGDPTDGIVHSSAHVGFLDRTDVADVLRHAGGRPRLAHRGPDEHVDLLSRGVRRHHRHPRRPPVHRRHRHRAPGDDLRDARGDPWPGEPSRDHHPVRAVVRTDPFALGAAVGAIASGRVPVGDQPCGYPTWLNPTSVLVGVLAVLVGTFLAAVQVTASADRQGDREMSRALRRRAPASGPLAGAVALAGPFVARRDAPAPYTGLLHGDGRAAVVVSALARYAAALAVAALVAGWAPAQCPQLLPGLSVAQLLVSRAPTAGAMSTHHLSLPHPPSSRHS